MSEPQHCAICNRWFVETSGRRCMVAHPGWQCCHHGFRRVSDPNGPKEEIDLTVKTHNHGPCLTCGKQIVTRHKAARKYCSSACSKKAYTALRPEIQARAHLSTGSIGALSELIACAQLMLMKYEVYRAVSPSSSCDLIGVKDGVTYRIEVKTGWRNTDGSPDYPRPVHSDFDLLAVVMDNSSVLLIPRHEAKVKETAPAMVPDGTIIPIKAIAAH